MMYILSFPIFTHNIWRLSRILLVITVYYVCFGSILEYSLDFILIKNTCDAIHIKPYKIIKTIPKRNSYQTIQTVSEKLYQNCKCYQRNHSKPCVCYQKNHTKPCKCYLEDILNTIPYHRKCYQENHSKQCKCHQEDIPNTKVT